MVQKIVSLTIDLPMQDYRQITGWAGMSTRTTEQQVLYFIQLGIERERRMHHLMELLDKAAETAIIAPEPQP